MEKVQSIWIEKLFLETVHKDLKEDKGTLALDLGGCVMDANETWAVAGLIHNIAQLSSLNLRGCYIGDEGAAAIAAAITGGAFKWMSKFVFFQLLSILIFICVFLL